jgi:hypothetical protein
LVRLGYRRRMWAIITLQSHVRRMIAERNYRKMRVSIRVVLPLLLHIINMLLRIVINNIFCIIV